MSRPQLTTLQRRLVAVVVSGAVLLAGIGFAGSYAAVRELAVRKGFGPFALVFPIGLDAGIAVLLALDLLLTWLRIPFPLLRHTAWLLTGATIAFNGAAAWPDPLGVGMHAVIPVLFVVVVEAGRHAIGRIADITASKHMDGVRLARWLLSPLPTFLMWRRMKLWELRSYEQVVQLEQDRLVYQAQLQARYGRTWRRKAPVTALLPLRLARYGRPLDRTTGTPAAAPVPVLGPVAVPDAYPAVLEPVPGPVPAAGLQLDLRTTPEPHPDVRTRVPVLAAQGSPTRVHARLPEPEPVPAQPVPVPDAVPTTGTAAGMAVLLELARNVDKQHKADHGRPASIKTLKRELHIGQPKAERVRAHLDQDTK